MTDKPDQPEAPGRETPLWQRLVGLAVALGIGFALSPQLAGPWLLLLLLSGLCYPEVVELTRGVAFGDRLVTPWGDFARERRNVKSEELVDDILSPRRRLEAQGAGEDVSVEQ